MILNMKTFVIQWRKFELKRSYINEDMNFLIFQNLLDFILIFQVFFRIYFIKIIAKRVEFIMRDSWS